MRRCPRRICVAMFKVFRQSSKINGHLQHGDVSTQSINFSNLFKFYFDFAYFLCLCPFRVKPKGRDYSTISFIKCSYLPQGILCVLFTSLGLLWTVRDIRNSIPKEPKNPRSHMLMMLSLVGSLYKATTLLKFWTCQTAILKILNYLGSCNKEYFKIRDVKFKQIPKSVWITTSKSLIVLLCLLYCCQAIIDLVSGSQIIEITSTAEISGKFKDRINLWWTFMVNTGKFNLFIPEVIMNQSSAILNDHGNESTVGEVSGESTTRNVVFGVTAALGYFQRYLVTAYADFLLLIATLTLWAMSRQLSNLVQTSIQKENEPDRNDREGDNCDSIMMTTENSNLSQVMLQQNGSHEDEGADEARLRMWNKLLGNFNRLVDVSNGINSTFGLNITCFLVEAVLYYSMSFDDIIGQVTQQDNPNWIKVVHVCFYFVNACAILHFSADVCYQVTLSFLFLRKGTVFVK